MADPFIELVRDLRVEIAALLREARRGGSSLPAVKLAQRTLKASGERWPTADRWACRSGCSFCCHNAVSVSAPEAFRLAREVLALPEAERAAVRATLDTRADQLAALTLEEQARRRTPCALLSKEGACGVYAARPLPCIGMVSLSAAACESVFATPERGEKIPVDRLWFTVSGAHNLALRLASRDAGLAHLRYELHDALRVALADPTAEQRWLAGVDPFSACRPDRTSIAPQALRELDELDRLTLPAR